MHFLAVAAETHMLLIVVNDYVVLAEEGRAYYNDLFIVPLFGFTFILEEDIKVEVAV